MCEKETMWISSKCIWCEHRLNELSWKLAKWVPVIWKAAGPTESSEAYNSSSARTKEKPPSPHMHITLDPELCDVGKVNWLHHSNPTLPVFFPYSQQAECTCTHKKNQGTDLKAFRPLGSSHFLNEISRGRSQKKWKTAAYCLVLKGPNNMKKSLSCCFPTVIFSVASLWTLHKWEKSIYILRTCILI